MRSKNSALIIKARNNLSRQINDQIYPLKSKTKTNKQNPMTTTHGILEKKDQKKKSDRNLLL